MATVGEFKGTKGEWKVRFFNPEEPSRGFFVEAPNQNKPELDYGIEILMEDFGEHNGYPLEQRLADAHLIADAGNTIQECGKLPSQLLAEVEELKEKIRYLKSGSR